LGCEGERAFAAGWARRGIRVVQTTFQAPNVNTYAERFVRSIKHECVNQGDPVLLRLRGVMMA
jgi:hypothetical protein